MHLCDTLSHLYKLPFNIRTRKSELSIKSMVIGMFLVLITEWVDLGIQGWARLPELQDQISAGVHAHREDLFACLPALGSTGVGSQWKAFLRADNINQRQ